jgi:hypothetical protein
MVGSFAPFADRLVTPVPCSDRWTPQSAAQRERQLRRIGDGSLVTGSSQIQFPCRGCGLWAVGGFCFLFSVIIYSWRTPPFRCQPAGIEREGAVVGAGAGAGDSDGGMGRDELEDGASPRYAWVCFRWWKYSSAISGGGAATTSMLKSISGVLALISERSSKSKRCKFKFKSFNMSLWSFCPYVCV